MAQNTTVDAAAASWTQLTDANVTEITFQNVTDSTIWIKGTTGTTAPTNLDGALRYTSGQGERNVALTDLFPGIAAARVWVYAENAVRVMVSHA